MQQLTGIDASFLAIETDASPMHVGSLIIYKPSERGFDFENLKRLVAHNVQSIPELSRKLVHVPLGLARPFWGQDNQFDLDHHLIKTTLPAPAGREQLMSFASFYFSTPLDLNRPLWSMVFVPLGKGFEEVPDGCFALLSKIHHAAVDGSKANNMLADLQSTEPRDIPPPVDLDQWIGQQTTPEPSRTRLLGTSLKNSLLNPVNGVKQTMSLGRISLHAARSLPSIDFRPQLAYDAPSTRFNKTLSGVRSYDGIFFPMEDIKLIRKAVPGTTLNDVVMSICAYALHHYLQGKDELPDKPLVSLVPISIRGGNKEDSNLVSSMLVNLDTGESDPIARLRKISRNAKNGKTLTRAAGPTGLMELTAVTPFALSRSFSRLAAVVGSADFTPPGFNLVISNIPGSRVPLYMGDAEMVAQLGMAPVMDGFGLVFTVNSYRDTLSIGVTTCVNMIPDMPDFMAHLQRAVQAHVSACTP